MSVASQFFGGGAKPPVLIVNGTSTNGSPPDFVGPSNPLQMYGVKKTVSGALTADTLKTVLLLTGSGYVGFMACTGADTTSRMHRLKMTVDGVVVFDGKTAAATSPQNGISLIGSASNIGTNYGAVAEPVHFKGSLLIEYASSLTETDKTNFYYAYRMY